MRRTSGFTLIEVLAVIALMALLTTIAAVSLSGAAGAARIEDAADAIAGFDGNARAQANADQRPLTLRFDLSVGTVERRWGDKESARLISNGNARIARVVKLDSNRTAGVIEIPISALGQSPSYAVKLSGAEGDRWIAFAGLTGQHLVINDDRELQDIFPTRRADTR